MKYPSSQFGFSLVEALVAITILLLVIVGPMTIVTSTANSTSFASDQVVAFFLAQEGVELAQKARDDLVLRAFVDPGSDYCAVPWDGFTYGSDGPITGSDDSPCIDALDYRGCYEDSGCSLQIVDNGGQTLVNQQPCGSGADACRLYYDDSDDGSRSRYTYTDTGNPTEYQRRIYLEKISLDSVEVRSQVEWFPGNTSNSQVIEVVTHLFNVYGK